MLKISLKNKLFSTIVITAIFTTSFFSINSNATSYYMRTVFDEGSFGLITQIIPDKSTDIADSHERSEGVSFSGISDYAKVYKGKGQNGVVGSTLIANIVLKSQGEDAKETYSAVISDDLNKGLVFTFPGLTSNIDTEVKYIGTSADAARAELVGNTLTKGINDALAFIKTYSGTQHAGGEGLRHVLAQLARVTSKFPDKVVKDTFNTGSAVGEKEVKVYYISGKDSKITVCGKKTAVVAKELIPVNGLKYSDYLIIGINSQKHGVVYGYFPWRMEKGYHPGDAMADYVGATYTGIARGETREEDKENEYVTWGQLIIQAGVNADVRATTSVDSSEDSMTLIGQGLGTDLTSTITAVRSLLNLAPIQELILNMGSRNTTHYRGVMTDDMYTTAKTVYTIALAVSLLFLGLLIVRMIHQKMISTTNIIAKTSLMEGLQDIVFVGVMLALFPSIFEILLEVNYYIVKIFSFSNDYLQAYGITGAKVLGTESLAGFMVSSMFLSIDTYINTTYLVRAIVVSFLFAISPIMTISYAWGPMQKKLYFSYMRELVGNIFMQSFHAITMSFFAGYNTSNMSAMEAVASTYCFIPITQLFRSLVIGAQGSFSEQIGGRLAGQLANSAVGLHKSDISRRQAVELNDRYAKNNMWSSIVNTGAQILTGGASLMGSNIQENAASAEIGNQAANAISGGANNGSNAARGGSSKAAAWKSFGLNTLANVGGSALTGMTEKNNRSNLGELQMKHSMENIGAGLAQAGIGLGISSFDTGAGSGMVSAGMGTVEKGAAGYGQGESNAGTGGTYYARGMAAQTLGQTVPRSMDSVHKQYLKDERRAQEETQRTAREQRIQGEKEKDRGLDVGSNGVYGNTESYINFPAQITKVEAHQDNKNNATFNVNAKSLENADSSNSLVNYLKTVEKHRDKKDGTVDMNHPEIQKALKPAVAEYGVSPTKAPEFDKVKGEISVMLAGVQNKLAMDIDDKGNTYASSGAYREAWQQRVSNGNNSNSTTKN